MPKALIIDDERAIRSAIREILEYEKIEVDEAEDGLQGVVKVKGAKYDVILCDIKMPKMDGTEVLDRIILLAPDTPVVMISGHGTIETAVDALKRGAYDYIPKPLDLNRLLVSVRNAFDRANLVTEAKVLRKKVGPQVAVPR
jgi:two-component system nitrogen regulation response regulator NtrX